MIGPMLRLVIAVGLVACSSAEPERPAPQTIRCAVIGGMIETGLWPELTARYERLTGNKVVLAASGPKPVIVEAFRKGGIDLITFHASDAMVNLVADGLTRDPQPWARNDFVIVGPKDDPAHVRGERDAVAALRKIFDAKAPFLVHASMGADGVFHELLEAGHIALPAESAVFFTDDNQHAVLQRTAEAKAYTIVGRIPFVNGKLARGGLELMVRGDPRLRRPYLVSVATHGNAAARDLAAFLRQPETQAWIAEYGKGRYDDDPLFFPVTVP
jgi:tungstate transport system substrate-binding protein